MDFDDAAAIRLVRDLHQWFPSFRGIPVEVHIGVGDAQLEKEDL